MKRGKKLYIVLFCTALFFVSLPLSAQTNKKVVKSIVNNAGKTASEQIAKTAASAQAQKLAQIPQAGSSAAVQSAANSLQKDKPTLSVQVNPTVARFVNRNKKLLYGLQKSVGISSHKAVENLYRWGAKPLKKPQRPGLLPEQTFTVQDFAELKYTRGVVPVLPFGYHAKYMYRGLGLALNGKAVRNILENGLLIKDVSPRNNDRRMAYASAGGLGAIKAILRESVINLTDSPVMALHYAWRNKDKGMVVLVAVKEELNRGGVITVPNDIPADKIGEMVALLQVHGKPTWCRIELAPEGFRVTPYSSPKQTKEP